MKPLPVLLGVLMLCACSTTPTASSPSTPLHPLPIDGPVSVCWRNPATFSEARVNRDELPRQRDQWVHMLMRSLHDEAGRRLPAGHTLRIEVVDVKRAGDYEPWQGIEHRHVRVLRDVYPPRIILRHVLRDATGAIVSEGGERLSGIDSLQAGSAFDSDPLRHEKRLLRDWAARRLGPAR